jgi:hypothetical protein
MIFLYYFAVRLSHAELDAFYSEHVGPRWNAKGLKFWACGICAKPGSSRQDVERHVESLHVTTDPYTCQQCEAQFSTKRGLTRHSLSVHR